MISAWWLLALVLAFFIREIWFVVPHSYWEGYAEAVDDMGKLWNKGLTIKDKEEGMSQKTLLKRLVLLGQGIADCRTRAMKGLGTHDDKEK